MSERNTPSPTDAESPDRDVSPCYQAIIDRRANRPDVCTIYVALTGDTATTEWISAIGDAFVSREDAR